MITDDRLLLYTINNWIFAEDFTGNIMSHKNINEISKECLKLGSIDLVTADGSIDCTEIPDIQEEVVFSLNFAEICAALNILSEGGSFVLKVFTLFEACTVSVMYFLNCVFEEVSVFKPATSSCGNSEVYVICINFQRNAEHFESVFQRFLENVDNGDVTPIFPENSIPRGYLFEHEICCRLFMGYQISIIKNNIASYENSSNFEYKNMERFKGIFFKEYMQRYSVQPIPKSRTILWKHRVKVQYKNNPLVHSGSFTERCEFKKLEKSEQLSILKNKFLSLKDFVKWPHSTDSIHFCSLGTPIEVNLITCKPITDVPSSKFIGFELLKHFRKEIENTFGKSLFCYFTKDPIEFVADDKVIRFKMKKSFGESEKVFFQNILIVLRKNKPNKVVLRNFIFLTHFSVSLLRILCSVFEDLWFTESGEIALENCKQSEWYVLNSIECEENVFSFLDIIHLHKNDFNEAVTNFNDQLLVKFTENALMTIERNLS
ncbi:CMTR2.2 family protein [Megaselia abdita]